MGPQVVRSNDDMIREALNNINGDPYIQAYRARRAARGEHVPDSRAA